MHKRCESDRRVDVAGLTYKFQRLREQIRNAILSGEYESRLPGERLLGRRYDANPKTVNKALCDLSREGLVIRQVGRGTFVAGADNGAPGGSRRRVFQCLLPPEPIGCQYREAMIRSVEELLATNGHVLDVLRIRSGGNADGIALADWKPTHRKVSDGLLVFPIEPLAGGAGQLSQELVAEALRRQVPIAVLAACDGPTKHSAVVPDYLDAGFRSCEHLLLIGCGQVIILRSACQRREIRLVVNGCRTAQARYGGNVREVQLEQNDGCALPAGVGSGSIAGAPPSVGVVCVGSRALARALNDASVSALRAAGRLTLLGIVEPGSHESADAGITAYENDPRLIATGAVRLLAGLRADQRPVEVVVPGALHIRADRPAASAAGGRPHPPPAVPRNPVEVTI